MGWAISWMIPASYSRRPRFPSSRQHEAVRYARACHTDMTRRLFQASEFGGDKSISPMGGLLRCSRGGGPTPTLTAVVPAKGRDDERARDYRSTNAFSITKWP